jgi:hypothetical protein
LAVPPLKPTAMSAIESMSAASSGGVYWNVAVLPGVT